MDAESGKSIRPPIPGHAEQAGSLSWSSDGSLFVTTALDGTVALWDGRSGVPRTTVLPERIISAAQFAADGTTVVITTYTDALYEWDTTTEHAVDFACDLVGRDFTEAEWSRFFGTRAYRQTCPTYAVLATVTARLSQWETCSSRCR